MVSKIKMKIFKDRISRITWMQSSSQPAEGGINFVNSILRPLFSGEKVLKFYWFDAYEDKFKQPGLLSFLRQPSVHVTFFSIRLQ